MSNNNKLYSLIANACLGNLFMGYAMTYLNPLASTITIAFNNHDAYFIGLLSGMYVV